MQSGRFGDVFRDNKFAWVEPAVRRVLFFYIDFSRYVRSKTLIEFCNWLLNDCSEDWLEVPPISENIDEFQHGNLANLDRFRTICGNLSERHYDDAFHIWTGEVNGLSHFLTADRKFIRTATRDGKIKLACTPIAPGELLSQLVIVERDALPFEYGKRYYLSGQPYD